MQDLYQAILAAKQRLTPFIKTTPLDYSVPLSKLTGCNVYLKCENLQYTGAFKIRGAFNKLLTLPVEQGVVTVSSGNHAAAVAYALKKLQRTGTIFVPENISPTKLDNIRNYIAAPHLYGAHYSEAEHHALAYADAHNLTFISPYNDFDIITGQGTIAWEIIHQLSEPVDTVLVPVGGGGLISGIATYLKENGNAPQVIGCLPLNSPVMAESIKQGHIIEMLTQPTLSDATAGGIEGDSLTFELCQRYVDDYWMVSEKEIKHAILTLIRTHHLLVEGAAGVALASLFKYSHSLQNKNVVVILSGGNISLETLRSLLYDVTSSPSTDKQAL